LSASMVVADRTVRNSRDAEGYIPAAARVSAAGILLDRGWGKAPQSHVGEDGGDLRVVQIGETRDED
jgi:hypothetical protein